MCSPHSPSSALLSSKLEINERSLEIMKTHHSQKDLIRQIEIWISKEVVKGKKEGWRFLDDPGKLGRNGKPGFSAKKGMRPVFEKRKPVAAVIRWHYVG